MQEPFSLVKTIWSNAATRWYIIEDEYGLGITDGYYVDRPIIYPDSSVAFDCPECLPKYIKERFKSMARHGQIHNKK